METPQIPCETFPEEPEKRVFLKFPQGVVELKSGTKIDPYQLVYIRGRKYVLTAKGCGYLDPDQAEGLYDLVFAEEVATARNMILATLNPDPNKTPDNLNPLILRDVPAETLAKMGLVKSKAA